MDSSRFEIEIYNLKVAESSHRISDPSEKQSPNEFSNMEPRVWGVQTYLAEWPLCTRKRSSLIVSLYTTIWRPEDGYVLMTPYAFFLIC